MAKTSFGKVILSGEHAAVYGQPAVAASVNLKVDAQLQKKNSANHISPFVQNLLVLFGQQYHLNTSDFSIRFSGNLPTGSGLGSSAASAHACFLALAENFHLTVSGDEMIALIQEAERFAHGYPSGLDATTVVKKGVIQFQRYGLKLEKLRSSSLPSKVVADAAFVLIQSGKPIESTKEMIERARHKYATPAGQQVVMEIGKITTQLITNLEKNVLDFDWISENEKYLEQLGVVGNKAKEIIGAIERIGGVAKVTGGGGYAEGSGIILAYHADVEKLADFLKQKRWEYYSPQLGVI